MTILNEEFSVQTGGRVKQMSAKEVELRQILKRAVQDKHFPSMAHLLNLFEKHGCAQRSPISGVLALPTKPVAMVADAIRDCSHRKAIVLDAFAGSGTTLIAAEKTGRRGYGIEIDPAYCDVTIRRLHAVCGLDAVLDASGQPFAEIEALRAAAAPIPVEAAPRLEGAT